MDQLDDDHFALFNFHVHFLADSHAEEEGRCIQHAYVAVFLAAGHPLFEHIGIEAVGGNRFVRGGRVHGFQFFPHLFKINGRQHGARALADGFFSLQHNLLQAFREAAVGCADTAFKELDDRFREVHGIAVGIHILFRDLVLHHVQGHVADDFGRRRNLDYIAEHHADPVIHVLDIFPAVQQPQGSGLLLQVGVLPARHLVHIHFRVGEVFGLIRRFVIGTDGFPVPGEFIQGVYAQLGLTGMSFQGIIQTGGRRLGGPVAHGAHGHVHDIHPGVDGPGIGVNGVAAAFMAVEMDRHRHRILHGADQFIGSLGFQKAGHILDGDDVGPGPFQFLGHIHKILQIIFIPFRIQNVPGVAQGRFRHFVALPHRFNGQAHVVQTVQGVEDTEHVHPVFGGQADKLFYYIVRIAGVTDGVGAPQQHLEQYVGSRFLKFLQPPPGAFVQEPVGHVESGAAPALKGEQLRQFAGSVFDDPQHVRRAQTGGEQGLVGVTEGGIRQQHFLLLLYPLSQSFRPSGVQDLFRAGGQFTRKRLGHIHGRKFRFGYHAHVGVAVHRNIPNIMQQFGTTVPAFREMEQLRRLIQEISGIGAVDKMRMLQQVFQKCDVGLHAADTEFLQAAQHLGHRDGMVQAPGGGLNQQRIIVRGDDRTREGIARVQTDAHAAAAAVGDELARIRHEIVQRVFRSDTALDSFAPDADLVLLRNAHFRTVDTVALRNADLALDDIDPRNGFRNGMFHLDTGVYFNKIELVVSGNQKFHSAGADVIHIFHQLHRRVADSLPQFRLHEGSRRHLHHLLVTALHGAVALEQVHDLALFVT